MIIHEKTALSDGLVVEGLEGLDSPPASPSPHLCKTSLQEWTPLRNATGISHLDSLGFESQSSNSKSHTRWLHELEGLEELSSHQSKSCAFCCRPRLAVSLNCSTSLRLFEPHATEAVQLLPKVFQKQNPNKWGSIFGGSGGARLTSGEPVATSLQN